MDMPSAFDLMRQVQSLQEQCESLREENAILRSARAERGERGERFYETILDNLYDGVAIVDGEGTITYESPSVERITGHRREALLGRNFFEFLHPDEHERIAIQFAEHSEQPGVWRGAELQFLHADGSWITLEARAINLVHVPEIGGFISIYRDVTERRLAEQRLHEAEARLAELSAKVPGILYQVRAPRDSQTIDVPFVSEGVRDLFGVDPEEVRHNPLAIVGMFPEEHRSQYVNVLGETIARGRPIKQDVPCVDRNGETRWLRVSAVPREYENGDLLYNGIAIDVSSEVRAQQSLEALNVHQVTKNFEQKEDLHRTRADLDVAVREKQLADSEIERLEECIETANLLCTTAEMMTGVAHDLQQPLTAIANYAGGCLLRLSRDSLDVATTREIFEEIKVAAMRAAEVVRRARDFTRTPSFDRHPIPVNEICESALSLGVIGLRERRIDLNVYYGAGLPDVIADRVPIAQVLLNLLHNAADALEGNPEDDRRIELRTELVDGMVRVSVTDNGAGLSAEARETIFERFVSSKPNGLGLGLSTCRSIINHHDGAIHVETGPEGGCAFHFTLPVA